MVFRTLPWELAKVVAAPDENLTRMNDARSRPEPADPRRGDHQRRAAGRASRRRTDAERLALVERELRQGFETLAEVGPAVCVFGSARTPADDPEYEQAREIGAGDRRGRVRGDHGRRPGTMEAANRGAREAGATSVGLNILLPLEQGMNPYSTSGSPSTTSSPAS